MMMLIVFAGMLLIGSMEQTKSLSYIKLFWKMTGNNFSHLSKSLEIYMIVYYKNGFFLGNLSQCFWPKGQGKMEIFNIVLWLDCVGAFFF